MPVRARSCRGGEERAGEDVLCAEVSSCLLLVEAPGGAFCPDDVCGVEVAEGVHVGDRDRLLAVGLAGPNFRAIPGIEAKVATVYVVWPNDSGGGAALAPPATIRLAAGATTAVPARCLIPT